MRFRMQQTRIRAQQMRFRTQQTRIRTHCGWKEKMAALYRAAIFSFQPRRGGYCWIAGRKIVKLWITGSSTGSSAVGSR